MPQMAPLPWTLIFLFTLSTLLIISTMIYFLIFKNQFVTKKNFLPAYSKFEW